MKKISYKMISVILASIIIINIILLTPFKQVNAASPLSEYIPDWESWTFTDNYYVKKFSNYTGTFKLLPYDNQTGAIDILENKNIIFDSPSQISTVFNIAKKYLDSKNISNGINNSNDLLTPNPVDTSFYSYLYQNGMSQCMDLKYFDNAPIFCTSLTQLNFAGTSGRSLFFVTGSDSDIDQYRLVITNNNYYLVARTNTVKCGFLREWTSGIYAYSGTINLNQLTGSASQQGYYYKTFNDLSDPSSGNMWYFPTQPLYYDNDTYNDLGLLFDAAFSNDLEQANPVYEEPLPDYVKNNPYYNTGLMDFDVTYQPAVPNVYYQDYSGFTHDFIANTDTLNLTYQLSRNQTANINNYFLNQNYDFDMTFTVPTFNTQAQLTVLGDYTSWPALYVSKVLEPYNLKVANLIDNASALGGDSYVSVSTELYDLWVIHYRFSYKQSYKVNSNGTVIHLNSIYGNLGDRDKMRQLFGYSLDGTTPVMFYINNACKDIAENYQNICDSHNGFYDYLGNIEGLQETWDLMLGEKFDYSELEKLCGYSVLELTANFNLNNYKSKVFNETYDFLTGDEKLNSNTLQNVVNDQPITVNDNNSVINTRDSQDLLTNIKNGTYPAVGGGGSSSSSSTSSGGSATGGAGGNASASIVYKGGIDWDTRPINGSNLNVAQGIGTGINVLKEYASGDIITLIKAEMDFIPQPVWNILIAVLAATAAICIFKFFIWIL